MPCVYKKDSHFYSGWQCFEEPSTSQVPKHLFDNHFSQKSDGGSFGPLIDIGDQSCFFSFFICGRTHKMLFGHSLEHCPPPTFSITTKAGTMRPESRFQYLRVKLIVQNRIMHALVVGVPDAPISSHAILDVVSQPGPR